MLYGRVNTRNRDNNKLFMAVVGLKQKQNLDKKINYFLFRLFGLKNVLCLKCLLL